MIRLTDHTVVISLRQIREKGLEEFATEILAHEIGHHVYAPADLRDNARLLARITAGLPSMENHAPLVSNLYTDLLINDRLQRGEGLDMSAVYSALNVESPDKLWSLYMLIYETLWNLPPRTLNKGDTSQKTVFDAILAAKIIRVYSRDWLDGAGRFAVLIAPYLDRALSKNDMAALSPIMDTKNAGAGDSIPDGLATAEAQEQEGATHPSKDSALTGIGGMDGDEDGDEAKDSSAKSSPKAGGEETVGGRKNQYRDPVKYTELMKSLGVKVSEDDLVINYYKELARPHLIRFPEKINKQAAEPLPEGLDLWEVGDPISELDWVESSTHSPVIIPGVTTVQRTYGETEGGDPQKQPLDLYLGIDCSGSMRNPKYGLSYPILAGTIVALSALRAKARVKATLSGEPGKYTSTDGFVKSEREIMKLLTSYLGTGYSFGVLRLKDTFIDGAKPKRPVHILIVTDNDIFYMLNETKNGWEIMTEALAKAGGGGTCLLNVPSPYGTDKQIEQLQNIGWNVSLVSNEEEMVRFARQFAKLKYDKPAAK
ncbi:MAG: VWA domain-containing protein [Nitrospinae bacterium]|nr:VWA domain-containing protein [Nitrospinota bacterium]